MKRTGWATGPAMTGGLVARSNEEKMSVSMFVMWWLCVC